MKKPLEFNNFPRAITDDPRWRGALWRWMAVSKEVTDGDTCVAMVDRGFRSYTYQSLRINGYDAWERWSGAPEERAKGIAAYDYLRALLAFDTPMGSITEREVETYQRWVSTTLIVLQPHHILAVHSREKKPTAYLQRPEDFAVGEVVDIADLFRGTEHEKVVV